MVQLFLRLQTQWRISPTGHRTGLDYSCIKPVVKMLGMALTPELFGDIQIMEITFINAG